MVDRTGDSESDPHLGTLLAIHTLSGGRGEGLGGGGRRGRMRTKKKKKRGMCRMRFMRDKTIWKEKSERAEVGRGKGGYRRRWTGKKNQ